MVAPAFVEADVDDDAAAPFDDDAAPSAAPDPDDVDGLLSSSGGSGNMKREQSVLTRILTCESIQSEHELAYRNYVGTSHLKKYLT